VSLEDLYKQLSNLSNSICARCTPAYHCCIPHGCKQAYFWTARVYKIELKTIYGDDVSAAKEMPFLSPTGCTLEPHYRPLCTNWLCEEGMKVAPPEFFELRKQIVRADAERWREVNAHSGG